MFLTSFMFIMLLRPKNNIKGLSET